MKRNTRHKIVTSSWINGRLIQQEFYYESLEIALEIAKTLIEGEVKIYNELDELVHCINKNHPWGPSYC